MAHFLDAQPGDRVLDVCAAPGSKSTYIGALAPQATIVATDLYEHRLRVLRELAANQGSNSIQLAVADAAGALPFAPASFDRVLVDAPCSGTGTLRRNPEIRWRLTETDIRELSIKQSQILRRAAEMVRAGGKLLYSTCSIEEDENEAVALAFMEAHGEFDQVPLPRTGICGDASNLLTPSGSARSWPHRHDLDGFFMIAFQRRI